jgi:hypothetical protein
LLFLFLSSAFSRLIYRVAFQKKKKKKKKKDLGLSCHTTADDRGVSLPGHGQGFRALTVYFLTSIP